MFLWCRTVLGSRRTYLECVLSLRELSSRYRVSRRGLSRLRQGLARFLELLPVRRVLERLVVFDGRFITIALLCEDVPEVDSGVALLGICAGEGHQYLVVVFRPAHDSFLTL